MNSVDNVLKSFDFEQWDQSQWIEGDSVFATDGRMMIEVSADQCDGAYEPPKTENPSHQVSSIIVNCDPWEVDKFKLGNALEKAPDQLFGGRTTHGIILKGMPYGVYLLRRLLEIAGDGKIICHSIGNNGVEASAALLEAGVYKAYIMPLSINHSCVIIDPDVGLEL